MPGQDVITQILESGSSPGGWSAQAADGDPAGDYAGVLADADQGRGLSLAQEMHTDEVEPRHYGARSVFVDRESEFVECLGPGEPGAVVGPEASRENDGAELGQVHCLGCLRLEGGGSSI